MRVVIHEAASLTAFEPSTVGTRVLDPEAFLAQVVEAIKREPDSCLLRLPGAEKLVSGRYGWRSQKPADYVTWLYKGHVHAFLKREFALPVRRVAVAVYPAEVYLRDKRVASDTVESNLACTATHVLVHVYADTNVSVDEPPTPWEFVHDLFNTPRANVPDALRLRDEAARVMIHDDHYSVVAD